MDRPLGAQISHMLKDRGVSVVFGIPGVHNQVMYRGIEEAGLRHVLARHEQGAGFMADGYARATGKPGVCMVISGPGLTNIMTPMGQAYSDSVPLLVISSCLDETAAKQGQLHQMKDQEAAARTVCDWSETARTPQSAYGLIDRALVEFRLARARPKHVQVPIALLGTVASPPGARASVLTAADVPGDVAQTLVDALKNAARPLFVFGGGAVGSADAWRRVLPLTGAASFATYAGRGVIPGDAPLHFGSLLARPGSAGILASADLVIAVGSELSEVDLWRSNLGHAGPLIRIDSDPARQALPDTGLHLHADAGQMAKELWRLRDQITPATGWSAVEVADFRARMRAEIDAERPGIVPVADALRAVLPAATTIYSDMTGFAYAAKEIWPMDRPRHWHHPYGFGTLGYALPAAIGGKIGLGDAPVIAIAGDYGFQYTLQELMVAVELELSLPVIIWDNNKLGEIEASMERAQIAPQAVHLRNPDFTAVARAFGAAAARPESLTGLQTEVLTALDRRGPTVIHLDSRIALG